MLRLIIISALGGALLGLIGNHFYRKLRRTQVRKQNYDSDILLTWPGDNWSISATCRWITFRTDGEAPLRLDAGCFRRLAEIFDETLKRLGNEEYNRLADEYHLAYHHFPGGTFRLLGWVNPPGAKLKINEWQHAPHLTVGQLSDISAWLKLASGEFKPFGGKINDCGVEISWQGKEPRAVTFAPSRTRFDLRDPHKMIAALKTVLAGGSVKLDWLELESCSDGDIVISDGPSRTFMPRTKLAQLCLTLERAFGGRPVRKPTRSIRQIMNKKGNPWT